MVRYASREGFSLVITVADSTERLFLPDDITSAYSIRKLECFVDEKTSAALVEETDEV